MIYLVLILLFLLASLLVFPIGLELDYSERGRRWYVLWMWLHIPVPGFVVRLGRSRRMRRGWKQWVKGDAEEEKERQSFGRKISDFVEGMCGGEQTFESCLQTLRSARHYLRIRVRRFHVVLATPNPALTGFSYGMVCALSGAFAPAWPIVVEPDFTRMTSEVSFRVEARVTVIRVVPAAWKFWRIARTRRSSEHKEDRIP